jgi:hypothetical protein
VFERKCLRDGLRDGAEASLPVRLAIIFAGRPAYRLIQKARGGFSGAGLNSCDDEDMQVICPTCQNIFAGSFKRTDHATLHGVVLDIFVERPIHGPETMLGRSDSGQVA